MEPFIARYRRVPLKNSDKYDTPNIRYDVLLEQCVFTDSSNLLVDSPEMVESMTGTIITKAEADPTSDEPTER